MLTEARAIALLVLFTVVAGFSVHREALTLTVCTQDCEYRTLNEAIAAAPNGALILLKAGNYQENLIIEKSITIRGQGSDKVFIKSAAERSALIQVRGESKLRLENLTLIGGLIGLELRDQSRAVVRYARLVNHVRGVAIVSDAQATLDRNEFRGVACAIWSASANLSLHGHSNLIIPQNQGKDVCGAAERLPVGFKS